MLTLKTYSQDGSFDRLVAFGPKLVDVEEEAGSMVKVKRRGLRQTYWISREDYRRYIRDVPVEIEKVYDPESVSITMSAAVWLCIKAELNGEHTECNCRAWKYFEEALERAGVEDE